MTILAGFSPIAAAGLSPSGASAHLQKLREAVVTQGRFRYYRIADEEVGHALEALANIAERARHPAVRRPRCPDALRLARVCYTHLAGRLGVALADALEQRGFVSKSSQTVVVTQAGEAWLRDLGITASGCGPRLRLCLDWTERRHHFAGPIASTMFRHLLDMRYFQRRRDNRALDITPAGSAWFRRLEIDLTTPHLGR
jgi:DNA-binding transcriptional ArsR family regulator